MANLVVTPSPNVFPVGTSIAAYTRHAQRSDGGPPAGAALETQTVASDNRATFNDAGRGPAGHALCVLRGREASLGACALDVVSETRGSRRGSRARECRWASQCVSRATLRWVNRPA